MKFEMIGLIIVELILISIIILINIFQNKREDKNIESILNFFNENKSQDSNKRLKKYIKNIKEREDEK